MPVLIQLLADERGKAGEDGSGPRPPHGRAKQNLGLVALPWPGPAQSLLPFGMEVSLCLSLSVTLSFNKYINSSHLPSLCAWLCFPENVLKSRSQFPIVFLISYFF